MTTSLLPVSLTGTLGASAAALGVIDGISDALAGVMKLIGGSAKRPTPADTEGALWLSGHRDGNRHDRCVIDLFTPSQRLPWM